MKFRIENKFLYLLEYSSEEWSWLDGILTWSDEYDKTATEKLLFTDSNGRYYTFWGIYNLIIKYISCPFPLELEGDNTIVIDRNIKVDKDILPGLSLMDFQLAAVLKSLVLKKGISSIPTGGGKTEIILAVLRYLLDNGLINHAVVVVPSVGLAEQFFERAILRGFNTNEICAMHSSSKYNGAPIIVGVVNSINIAMDKDGSIGKLIRETDCLIYDECFHPNTNILLPDNTYTTISEIYRNDYIKEIISYNSNLKVLEKKKILRKIKKEYNNRLSRITYRRSDGTVGHIKATPNHKFFTKNKGYVELSNLSTGDILINMEQEYKSLIKICPTCSLDMSNLKGNEIGGHVVMCSGKGKHVVPTSGSNYWMNDPKYKESKEKMYKNRSKNKEYCNKISIRMIKDNPVYKDGVLKKISESLSKNLEFKERLKHHWISLPRSKRGNGKMTSCERIINEFNLPLKFNGSVKGAVKYKFNTGEYKIPDFLTDQPNKVIEVSNTSYWYTKEYTENCVKKYKEIGIDCLYFEDTEIYNNPGLCKERIETFIKNHDVEVIGISHNYRTTVEYVYDLEVEENHNYFADGILVSNCHHGKAASYVRISLDTNPKYLLYYSGSPFSQKNILETAGDVLLFGIAGSVIYTISQKYVRELGLIAEPLIYFKPIPGRMSKFPGRYNDIYENNLVKNKSRNQIIVTFTSKFVNLGFKTLILVQRLEHAKALMLMLKNHKVICVFGGQKGLQIDEYGMIEEFKVDYNIFRNNFENGAYDIVLGSQVIDEGFDIPSIGAVVLGGGGKSRIKLLQRVGRGLRRKKFGKNQVYIVDFQDKTHMYLHAQYRKRKALMEEIEATIIEDEFTFFNMAIQHSKELKELNDERIRSIEMSKV